MISHAYQQFVMGHAGDIERTYTLSKCNLPREVIEDVRVACRKASQSIQTNRLNKREDTSLLKSMREGFLIGKGYTPMQLSKMDLHGITNDEFFKLLKQSNDGEQKNQGEENSSSRPNFANNNGGSSLRHEGIPISQLKQFLSAGCKYMDQYLDEDGKRMAIVQIGF